MSRDTNPTEYEIRESRDEYEAGVLADRDAVALMNEVRARAWTWPAPSPVTVAAVIAADLKARTLDRAEMIEAAAVDIMFADQAARRARRNWIELLPAPTPDRYACTGCGSNEDWIVREIGFERWTMDVEIAGTIGKPIMHPCADGWDDMTESGTDEWLRCESCNTDHAMADMVEWR